MNEKKYLNRRVIIEPYNTDWPEKFLDEKNKIFSVIGDKNPAVEHIGSTAIIGLAAKTDFIQKILRKARASNHE